MKKTIVAATFTGLMAVSAAAESSPNIGVLGVYEVEDSQTYQAAKDNLKRRLEGRGCQIHLEGAVLGEDGDVDLTEPNRFLYLECEQTVLGSKERQKLFQPLKSVITDLAVFEGPIHRPENGKSVSKITDRSYIVKVSYYNNQDPLGRDNDLKEIEKNLEGLENIYRSEAEIAVTEAYGAKTPDEAVLIYYDTPEQGEKFRSSNKKILKMIGAFNEKHLESYIYYIAKAGD